MKWQAFKVRIAAITKLVLACARESTAKAGKPLSERASEAAAVAAVGEDERGGGGGWPRRTWRERKSPSHLCEQGKLPPLLLLLQPPLPLVKLKKNMGLGSK